MPNCIQCGAEFAPRHRKVFCTKKCADKNYIENNKEKKAEYDLQRYLDNPIAAVERVAKWRKENPEARREYDKKLQETSFKHYFYKNAMTMIGQYLKGQIFEHRSKILSSLPFSIKELDEKLRSSVPEGYAYLSPDLHLDHIKPHSKFNYESIQDEEFKECWSLNNLRLLPKEINISPLKRIEYDKRS